ncbi:MAG: DUF4426 domain-containing protein [Gammaproteobacteria bacterium]|jgi:hypothetical protein|nr:DUF4426 domain-containing protein [Gammaproteobacteria bacterium]
MYVTARILVTLLAASLLVACGRPAGQPASIPSTQALEPADASSRDFGDYVLLYSAIPTDTLTPEIASNYGIMRSANRVLLNVSMLKKAEGAPDVPVPGKVSASAVNLNGQAKNLSVREIREGEAIYYVGDVSISGEEILVFSIEAQPADASGAPMAVRFQRQFYGN